MALTRSFWAWGYEEKFPDETERTALAQAVGALLQGASTPSLRPLPRFADARLPAPRLSIPPRLADFASSDARERALRTYGKSFLDQLRAFALDFGSAPDFVLLPRDEDEVILALAECALAGIAVIPFGGGTSVVGGVEAEPQSCRGYRGVAALDLQRLDKVLEVDTLSGAARIQAGAMGPSIEAQLAAHDLTLRHYPQSFELSTLGGWLATRAGGHFATLYTHIDDFVESVRVVTPQGVLQTRRLPASGAGPAPERLLLGSEGALGIFTEAWLRVQRRPRFRSAASVSFAALDQAVAAVRAVAQAGLYPSNCRLLDASEALLHGVGGGGGGPVLLLGFESSDRPMAEPLARALAIVTAGEYGGSCPRGPVHREAGQRGGDGSAESWRQAFFAAPYRQSALLSLGIMADTFETACTWERFPHLHAAVRAAIEGALKECCGRGLVTMRFTHVYPDGPAPYFTFLAPLPADCDMPTAADIWRRVKRAASDAILEQGGTITHHHSVGRTHLPWYRREQAPLFGDALAAVKRTLDPTWVLNPGALTPLR